MSGPVLIVAFVVAIVAMIWAISKWKVHPFLAIMAISLIFGLAAGIPLVDVRGPDGTVATPGIATVIGQGFSATFTSIGIVIILGALIGAVLEATGGAFKLADMVVRVVGRRHPEVAMQVMGWIVSIPVFCDSGFVILNPIRQALVRRTAASSVMMTMALSGGLYIAHVFIPPTPGPIAAANTLGVGDNLLLVMGVGALVSVFPGITLYVVARWLGRRERAGDEFDTETVGETYEELRAAFGRLPNGFLTLGPIVIPILLMALGSVSSVLRWPGLAGQICGFLGTPVIALACGVVVAVFTLRSTGTLGRLHELCDETLRVVGPILFITGAGGVLGRVIANTGIVAFITENAAALSTFGILFPFLLSAILKTAQGSSTVALVTTAGIVAPMLPALGMQTPILVALCVMAIAAGAMTVSHANDSYFWVVTKFGQLEVQQGYRTQTLMTLCLGLSSMLEIFLLWLVFR